MCVSKQIAPRSERRVQHKTEWGHIEGKRILLTFALATRHHIPWAIRAAAAKQTQPAN